MMRSQRAPLVNSMGVGEGVTPAGTGAQAAKRMRGRMIFQKRIDMP